MILLFDIDGVLIHNFAYHACLARTVTYFARRMGLGDLTLTETEIEVFESQSVTVEWDSGAISVAALLMAWLDTRPAGPLPPDLWAALDGLAATPTAITRPDYAAIARRVGAATPPGGLPSSTALNLFLADLDGLALPPEIHQPARALLHHLLDDRYNIDRAPAMQVFQNYALGHQQFTHYYSIPARLESESLLETLDRPALAPEMRDRVLAKLAARELYAAIYTARPTLAPAGVGAPQRGYTPEAEIARQLVGLDPLPVTGFGKLHWFAQRVGLHGEDLIKPSIFQAIYAMSLARTGDELESLKAAFAILRGDHLRYPLTACANKTIHVFEDSSSSLRAVTRAVEALNRQGLNLTLVRHGIAPTNSPKQETLAQIADMMHNNINAGLAEIFKQN